MTSDAPNLTLPARRRDPTAGSLSPVGGSLSAESFLSLASMEGVYDPVVALPAPKKRVAAAGRAALAPGYVVAGGVAGLAYVLHFLPVAPFSVGQAVPLRHPVSATIIAILIGLCFRNVLSLPDSIRAGCKHIVKKIIPVAIVLTGAGLNLLHIASVGLTVLFITVSCITVAMLGGYYIGRAFGLSWKMSLLLGTGTGICGNSAIVAVAPLVDAGDDDLVLSIGAVNLFGLMAMLAWPVIGGLLHISSEMFGVWCGTSIHAVPQVVAAGFAFSPEAGTLATLIKLVRVTMLAPLVFILAILYTRHHAGSSAGRDKLTVRYTRLVPWFVTGFVLVALLNTLGLLPTLHFRLADFFAPGETRFLSVPLVGVMTHAGKILLTLAMAAIGLEVKLSVLTGIGGQALKAGLLTTLAVGATSLALITLLL